MKCLNCGAEMENYLIRTKKDEISYDTCPECGSLWLDAGELDKMAFQVEGSIEYSSQEETQGTVTDRRCPRCKNVVMGKVNFLGSTDIFLDRCPCCGGFWLDGGELDILNLELEDTMPVTGHGFSDFIHNIHIPYWHKRIRRKDPPDFGEKVLPLKNASMKDTSSLACPACDARMNSYEAYGMSFEGCQGCKGLWLSLEELRKLKDRVGKKNGVDLRWLDDEVEALEESQIMPSGRQCPECSGQELVSTSFGNSTIIIDWCPSCKHLWLDGGEFQRMMAYLREQYANVSREDIEENLREEMKEIWEGPEGKFSELLDAAAAVSTFLSLGVFQHPKLVAFLQRFSENLESSGI
ncbi:MAG: zf-TFIIB domain-containing protein [Candidatus Brocadiia bacterium]